MAKMESNQSFKIGSLIPSFSLLRADGVRKNYVDYFDGKNILVVFMCNHCPYVIPKIKSLIEIQEKYIDTLNVIGINSNDATDYPEDHFDRMAHYVKEWGLNFDYLHDDTQFLAYQFKAVCTPDLFLFDDSGLLYFHGALDLEHKQESNANIMHAAIQSLIAQKEFNEEAPSLGCSIKWTEKNWKLINGVE
jgi:thiol-disulfide isomerase/thioredoxin